MKKLKRTRWVPQQRDLDLLTFLGLRGYSKELSARQAVVRHPFFPSYRVAARRLRLLRREGFLTSRKVKVQMIGRPEEFYSIAPRAIIRIRSLLLLKKLEMA